MLSALPQLFDYQFYVPFILRSAAGLVFITWGWQKFSAEKKDFMGWIEMLGGILLIAGLFTQITALVLFLEFVSARVFKKMSKGWELDLLIIIILLAILVLGPGIYAVDYPL